MASAAGCLGRCTLLLTCLSMCGSDYRKHTVHLGRDLESTEAEALAGAFSPPEAVAAVAAAAALYPKPLADAAWLLHDVSSAAAEELLRLLCVSTKRQPPASLMQLGTKSRKVPVFVRTVTAAARVPSAPLHRRRFTPSSLRGATQPSPNRCA